MDLKLTGKTAFITGGSRGIGLETARMLAKEGVKISLFARNPEHLEKAKQELSAYTRDVLTFSGDVKNTEEIKRALQLAGEKFGAINFLINNAGGAQLGGVLEVSDQSWEEEVQRKLLAYIRVARETTPWLKRSGGGCVVNIVGGWGKEPDATAVIPSVMNAGLLAFTQAFANEVVKDNIRVYAVNPGATATSLGTEMAVKYADMFGASPEQIGAQLISSIPMGRIGTAADVAKIVLFMCSDLAGFVTGVNLNVDGGAHKFV